MKNIAVLDSVPQCVRTYVPKSFLFCSQWFDLIMNERAKWFMRTNFTHESVHDSHTVKYIFTCMWAGVKVACACTADIRVYLYVELSRVAAHFTEQ